jgi:polynucleotide 5'-kinase involved in rRNA processing
MPGSGGSRQCVGLVRLASMEASARTGKRHVLDSLTFGQRVAEDEREELADYFVETDQWQKVESGQIDVVFGPKGAGKSAIYTSLMNRERQMSDRGIILITAEKPRGNTWLCQPELAPP